MHVRQQIRDQINVNLSTLVDVKKITKIREPSFTIEQLPAINIITDEDDVDTGQEWMNCTEHTIVQNVKIEVYLSQCDEVEDTIDDLIVQVQRNMYQDLKLGGIATDTRYISSTKTENRGTSELPTIVRELEYEVKYTVDLLNADVSTSN